MPFLDFQHLTFRYEPFPRGLARPVMSDAAYAEFTAAFPALDVFESYDAMAKPGCKYTLSERENRKRYLAFVRGHPLWREFHAWIKSDDFCYGMLDVLCAHHVDLGYRRIPAGRRALARLRSLARGRRPPLHVPLRARFEFSALPAEGGYVVPHTDSPSKIVTLVVSMCRPGEWDPAWGGGTDMCRHRESRMNFNHVNELAAFEDVETFETHEFLPNQALVFVKTFNSWHAVRPTTGAGSHALRKSLTIVIETVGLG